MPREETGIAHSSLAAWSNLKPGGCFIRSLDSSFPWCEVISVPVPPGHTIYTNLMKDLLSLILKIPVSGRKRTVKVGSLSIHLRHSFVLLQRKRDLHHCVFGQLFFSRNRVVCLDFRMCYVTSFARIQGAREWSFDHCRHVLGAPSRRSKYGFVSLN